MFTQMVKCKRKERMMRRHTAGVSTFPDLYTAILSGGTGSRLWPVSTRTHPKPFIKLNDGFSIFQHTMLTALELGTKEIVNVTASHIAHKVQEECTAISQLFSSSTDYNYIMEPTGRGTAAAIALASLWIAERYADDEILLVLPSDQIISKHEEMSKVVKKAISFAKQSKIVTLGIKPTYAATGYGYIEYENYDVKNFIEKPSLDKAKQCFESGKYLWNSGIFCFKVKTMLQEMAIHCPDILAGAAISFERAIIEESTPLKIDSTDFERIREDSIDYAIIERSNKIAVIPCDIGWSDFGSWDAISKLSDSDDNGNVITSEVITNKVTNCYIDGRNRIIGAVGLDNLVIVDTPDALLVANKNNTQDIKNIYNYLMRMSHRTHELHNVTHTPNISQGSRKEYNENTPNSLSSFLSPLAGEVIHKSWGNYTMLQGGNNFKIRRIQVDKDFASLSLNSDYYYHLIVADGTALVNCGQQELVLGTGQSTQTIGNNDYKLSNLSDRPLIVIEIQHKSTP